MDTQPKTKNHQLTPRGATEWMARNPVAANLLALVLILGGLLSLTQVKQEVFPSFDLGKIHIGLQVNGANPQQIEQSVILAIEDAVLPIDGIKKIASSASDSTASITLDLHDAKEQNRILQEVKNAVDRIQTLPSEAERPIVSLLKEQDHILSLILFGDAPLTQLHETASKLLSDLRNLESITLAKIQPSPQKEISIEVSQNTLRSHQLSLETIAETVRQEALERSAGSIRTPDGLISLKADKTMEHASDYSTIPIQESSDGTPIPLQHIATLSDTFSPNSPISEFNGKSALKIEIFRSGNETPAVISKEIRSFVSDIQLPPEIQLTIFQDETLAFKDRTSLLLKNAWMGLILVIITLSLFLEPRVAFWVTFGIPISFIGSMLILPSLGGSINMISLTAFIITLGVVVDDAMIIGESIYAQKREGKSAIDATIAGIREMRQPIIFAVLTNIVAFLPMFFLSGFLGKILVQIPIVVVSVLSISLIESLFILPAHLARESVQNRFQIPFLHRLRKACNRGLERFANGPFSLLLNLATDNRAITVSLAVAGLFISFGLLSSGIVKTSFTPNLDGDIVTATATLPPSASEFDVENVRRILYDSAEKALDELGGSHFSNGIAAFTQVESEDAIPGTQTIELIVALCPPESRTFGGVEFSNTWERLTKKIPATETLQFSGVDNAGDEPILIELYHEDIALAEVAAEVLCNKTSSLQGVVRTNSGSGQAIQQFRCTLKPAGYSLGFQNDDLNTAIRNAFYGAEALRIQRGRDEVRVMVRLPEPERENAHTLQTLIIQTPNSGEVALSEIAHIEESSSPAAIIRSNGNRIVPVSIFLKFDANEDQIAELLTDVILPDLHTQFPKLRYAFAGEQQEDQETLAELAVSLSVALIGVYVLLAIQFNSYRLPVLIMFVIPFGVIGAIWGHLLLGYEVSIVSFVGILALSGIVVNDSLVLIVTTQSNRSSGDSPTVAVLKAAKRRIRPILLTSLTTFLGLAPLMFETSVQARFLIPMTISIGFGILFATVLTLILIPCLYLVLEGKSNKRILPSQS